jgi:hypothetical protein
MNTSAVKMGLFKSIIGPGVQRFRIPINTRDFSIAANVEKVDGIISSSFDLICSRM